MTRKHFNELAAIVKSWRLMLEPAIADDVADDVADFCRQFNQRFDRDRFIHATQSDSKKGGQ